MRSERNLNVLLLKRELENCWIAFSYVSCARIEQVAKLAARYLRNNKLL